MHPATTTSAIPSSFSSSAAAQSILPSSSPTMATAIDPLLDASLITDVVTPLNGGLCADGGHWFCCLCTMGPHLDPHNVGCGNCGHVKCAGCTTK